MAVRFAEMKIYQLLAGVFIVLKKFVITTGTSTVLIYMPKKALQTY
jgi:hypothetical protein